MTLMPEQSEIVEVRHLGRPGTCGHVVEVSLRPRGLRRRDVVRMILPLAVASLLVWPGRTKVG